MSRARSAAFLHLYIGEKRSPSAAGKRSHPDDHIFTASRDQAGHRRGLDPEAMMAELPGKATGVSGGKGGSMHLASAGHRYWGGHAIGGGHLRATGVGLGIRYNEKHEAVLCVWAKAPPISVISTNPSTWQPCGSCRWCSWSKTTNTAWEPRSAGPRRFRFDRETAPTTSRTAAVARCQRGSQVVDEAWTWRVTRARCCWRLSPIGIGSFDGRPRTVSQQV